MLDWANLKGVHLEGACLRRTNLKRANLEAAHLEGANFENANLKRALLNDANMQATVLAEARLENAYLAAANLKWANLRGAILRRALLRGTCLEEAHLQGASLEEAVLVEANLERCRLDGACLDRARADRVRLRDAQLRSAVLLGTDLRYAELVHTNLEGAILVEANLEAAELAGSNFDKATLGGTYLIDVDVTPLVDLSLTHRCASKVDFATISKSISCAGLKQFLRDVGMAPMVVEDMVGRARAMDPSERLAAVTATYVAFVEDDESIACKLHRALKEAGIATYLYPFDAKLGELSANALQRRVTGSDRVIVICSQAMFERVEIVKELSDTQRRDRALGERSCLYPVILDDSIFAEDFKRACPSLAAVLATRVIGDFRGAHHDEALFRRAVPTLVDALKNKKLELVTASAS